MRNFAQTVVVAAALALPLGGCVNFDPADMFAGDWFGNKKPLPGERRELFPGGVPGVARGVPSELMKGDQTAALQDSEPDVSPASRLEEPKAVPKAKPKPKPVAAKPVETERRPTAVTVRPQGGQPQSGQPQQSQWPDPPAPPARQPSQSSSPWPDPPAPRAQQQQSVQWPDPTTR